MQVLELAALHPANAKAVDRAMTYLVQSVIAGVVAGMASVRNGSKADARHLVAGMGGKRTLSQPGQEPAKIGFPSTIRMTPRRSGGASEWNANSIGTAT